MTTTRTQPSHLLYHVEKREGNGRTNWTEIGTLWPHKDGEGFSVKLRYLSLQQDAELVARVYKPKGSKQTA
ncbi:MAG: hypothetical protein R3A44_38355 [Caldilineaceae bacterium]